MPYSPRQRAALFLVPPLAATLLRLLGMTLRDQDVTAPGVLPGDRLPGPAVYAFWHRTLLVSAFRFRNRGIAILISQSFDGELIARTVERLGFRAIRGSSSRGGVTALRQMADAYAQGHLCAFTADGPRGPAGVAKPGAAQLAQLVDAPFIGAFHAQPSHAWVLPSWDRFLIPMPFSRVAVAFSRPALSSSPDLFAAVQTSLEEAASLAETSARK